MHKKRLIFILSYIFLIACFAATFINVKAANITYKNVDYDYSLLKVNIPTGYYDNVDLNENQDNFVDTLCSIISANYVQYSYDDISKILHLSDVDPENTDNVIGIYSGLSLTGGWNREHIWCKSHGFSGSNSYAPYTDAHHLRAANANINSTRNNSDFGEVNHATASHDIYGNYWTENVYEPRDEVKGDCARMILYMAIRYHNTSPYYAEVIEGGTVDKTTANGKSYFGYLSTLLKWHYQDPVSEEEIYRNNVVYSFQKNRNPFIDHPEYVEHCWDVSGIAGYNVDTTVTDSELTTLTQTVNNLPATITLAAEEQVNAAHDLYKALNNNEKIALPQATYNKLFNAVKEIRTLNKAANHSEYKQVLEFKNVFTSGSASYQSDISATVNGYNVFLSHAYHMSACYEHQVSLGNKTATTLSSYNLNLKFSLNNSYGDYLKVDYNFEDMDSIDFYCPALYRDASYFKGWYIAVGNDTDGYNLAASGNNFQVHMHADFNEPVDGKILLIFTGSTVCASLETLTVKFNEPSSVLDSITGANTLAQLAFNYECSGSTNYSTNLSGSKTDLNVNGNNASLLGLNSSLFTVEYTKNNNNTSNASATEVRLYAGDILKLTCPSTVTSISLTKSTQNDPTNNGAISIDGTNYTTITSLTDIPVNSTVFYLKANAQIRFTNIDFICGSVEVSNMKIRFGVVYEYSNWQALLEEYNVTGYGVLLAKSSDLDGSIVDKYNAVKGLVDQEHTLEDYFDDYHINHEASVEGLESNLTVYRTDSNGQEVVNNGDYIFFNALLSVDMNQVTTDIKAVAYIIVDYQYIFFGERELSYSDVAQIYFASNNYDGDLQVALGYLANK